MLLNETARNRLQDQTRVVVDFVAARCIKTQQAAIVEKLGVCQKMAVRLNGRKVCATAFRVKSHMEKV